MSKPRLAMVVAATVRGEIGAFHGIPWRLEGDLKRFADLTTGQVVIMGSKTHESIGRMLPNRINIVVSSRDVAVGKHQDLLVVKTIEEAVEKAKSYNTDWIYFIGGAAIYEYAMKVVEKVEWTIVHDRDDRLHMTYDTVIKDFTFLPDDWVCTQVIRAPDTYYLDSDIPLPSHTWVTLERV